MKWVLCAVMGEKTGWELQSAWNVRIRGKDNECGGGGGGGE